MLFSDPRVAGFAVGIYSKLWTPPDKVREGCSDEKSWEAGKGPSRTVGVVMVAPLLQTISPPHPGQDETEV